MGMTIWLSLDFRTLSLPLSLMSPKTSLTSLPIWARTVSHMGNSTLYIAIWIQTSLIEVLTPLFPMKIKSSRRLNILTLLRTRSLNIESVSLTTRETHAMMQLARMMLYSLNTIKTKRWLSMASFTRLQLSIDPPVSLSVNWGGKSNIKGKNQWRDSYRTKST